MPMSSCMGILAVSRRAWNLAHSLVVVELLDQLHPDRIRVEDNGVVVHSQAANVHQNLSDLGRIVCGEEIDHLVPLHEAHLSGGATWDPTRKHDFANDTLDPSHLIAVEGSINGSKSDRDPSRWLPTTSFRCTYLAAWTTIKSRWNLSMDSLEYRVTRDGLDSCAAVGAMGMPRI